MSNQAMNAIMRAAVVGRSFTTVPAQADSTKSMNEAIRGVRQPRDEHGRFTSADLVEHPNPDAAPLLRARKLAEQAGDLVSVADIDNRLRRIDPDLAPPVASVDAGAGRGQNDRIGANPNDLVRAELRGAMIARRQQHIELGSDGRIPAADLANLEPRGRLP